MPSMKVPNIIKKIIKRRLFLFVIASFILVILILLGRDGQKENIEFVQVRKDDIKTSVAASGRLAGKQTANLKFKTGGKLAFVNFKNGDFVDQGQTIAGLDTQDLSINLQQAENNLRDKQATVEKVLDDIRLFQYGNEGTTGETQLQKQTRTSAEVARDNAFDAVKEAKRALSDAFIVSPLSGIILKADLVPGQTVLPTDLVAQVADTNQIFFDAEVDEADISKISINQQAEVTLNAYPDQIFPGNVAEILPQTKITISGATVIIVRIDLHQPSISFIADLNGQAEIINSQAKNTLLIPQEALKDNNAVFIKSDSDFKSVPVKVGISSDTDIQIQEGLEENQTIVKNSSAIKTPRQGLLQQLVNLFRK